jgi:hypothetical protein
MRIMMPMIGGIHKRIKTGLFFLSHVASQAPPIVATIWTTPNGMLKRMVAN